MKTELLDDPFDSMPAITNPSDQQVVTSATDLSRNSLSRARTQSDSFLQTQQETRTQRSQSIGCSKDIPNKLETLRNRLSAAASGPTQLWLFLLELLLLEPDQKCIRWTGRGWEFLMGNIWD